MLSQLRTKFVIITMVLTGIVLFGVLGSTIYTTWATQQALIDEALDRAISDDLDSVPMMGGIQGPRDHGPRNNLLALAVDVSKDGVVVRTGRAPVTINSSVLAEVVSTALESDDDSGSMPGLHVKWKRAYYEDSLFYYDIFDELLGLGGDADELANARIAIVDTTALDNALIGQVRGSVLISVAALASLFVIAWVLSNWALEPVKRAWDDQRRFVSDASHELKTPLAVIIANTDILKADETLPAESRRWVDSTADEAAIMRSLVNDLLELARADESSSSGVMRREQVDFSDIVDSASLEFDAIAYDRGCLIESRIEPGIIVQGDPDWLTRLVKILIDNACKYAEENSTITVRLGRNQSKTVFAVSNQGNPIDPSDLEHVFDRFYRSDKARARETGGFGLGLAIAKGLTESHGGTISATSNEADGTTFTVTLP